MHAFESRLERLELKYLIDTRTAARIRRHLAPYCLPDEHNLHSGRGDPPESPGYRICSLYLDTPSLAFHRAKERGDPERLKLRVRSYDGRGDPFLEIKQRSADVIEKTRVAVAADQIQEAAQGFGKLRRETPDARRFQQRYAGLVLSSGAEPTLLVRYDREAYSSSVDHYTRLSFDRNLAFKPMQAWNLDGGDEGWCDLESHLVDGVPRPLVVLEIKCQSSVPAWTIDLIRRHDLRRASFSKYSTGIYLTRRVAGFSQGQERARGVLR